MTQIEFYNENCFDTMSRMKKENKKVDIILTSPPYNTARTQKSQRSFDNYENRYDVHLDSMTDEEYAQWTLDLFKAYDEILVKDGVILYNVSYGNESPNSMWLALLNIVKDSNFMIADKIVWKKKSALPNNVSKNKLTRITEDVYVICRKSEYKTFNANKPIKSHSATGQAYYCNIFNFIEASNNDGTNPYNKATYSTDLCLQLLNIYANDSSIVYDSFMGTGTTAKACRLFNNGQNNMICYGSELSEQQVEYSKQRIKEIDEACEKQVKRK